jgi:exonuclease SbcC
MKALKDEITDKKKELAQENENLKSLEEEYNTYTNKIAEVKVNQKHLDNGTKTLDTNKKSLEECEKDLAAQEQKLNDLPSLELTTSKSVEELEAELKTLRKKDKKLAKDVSLTEKRLADVEKLLKEGKCSLCGQAIHEKKRFDAELQEAEKLLHDYNIQSEDIEKKVNETEELRNKVREQEKITQKKEGILGVIEQLTKKKSELSSTTKELRHKIEKVETEIFATLNSYGISSLDESKAYEDSLKQKKESQEKIVEAINEDVTQLEKKLIGLEKDLENLDKDLNDAQDALEYKQQLKEKSEYMGTLKTWISDHFPILLKDIERTILASTASLFNQYFKEWFRSLVEEENIDIQINPENFQPIVIVDGYESQFEDLSGGEKSALSLAYRLALNKVINTKHQDVKTKDLLILDEPTDGFSEQQVNKMQGVFETLNMKQMIIISHERTLDSFVSKIFSFKKLNHQTKIFVENS